MKNKSKGKMLNMKTRSAITGYAYIAPWIAGFPAFYALPAYIFGAAQLK